MTKTESGKIERAFEIIFPNERTNNIGNSTIDELIKQNLPEAQRVLDLTEGQINLIISIAKK